MLEEDIKEYPVKSGAFTCHAFAETEISETQKNMEATVGEFLVDDTLVADSSDVGLNLED